MSSASERLASVTLALVIGVATSSCAHDVAVDPAPPPMGHAAHHGKGPPPHAPAHGYRAKTEQDVDVVFDTGLGVYVVVDVPNVFYLDDYYYRRASSGAWERSHRHDGGWAAVSKTSVPPGLRAAKKGGPPAVSPGKAKKAAPHAH